MPNHLPLDNTTKRILNNRRFSCLFRHATGFLQVVWQAKTNDQRVRRLYSLFFKNHSSYAFDTSQFPRKKKDKLFNRLQRLAEYTVTSIT